MSEVVKLCNQCMRWLSLGNFASSNDKRRPNKRRSHCRDCCNLVTAAWRARNVNYHTAYNARRKAEKTAGIDDAASKPAD